jgi:hypothetical protein
VTIVCVWVWPVVVADTTLPVPTMTRSAGAVTRHTYKAESPLVVSPPGGAGSVSHWPSTRRGIRG